MSETPIQKTDIPISQPPTDEQLSELFVDTLASHTDETTAASAWNTLPQPARSGILDVVRGLVTGTLALPNPLPAAINWFQFLGGNIVGMLTGVIGSLLSDVFNDIYNLLVTGVETVLLFTLMLASGIALLIGFIVFIVVATVFIKPLIDQLLTS